MYYLWKTIYTYKQTQGAVLKAKIFLKFVLILLITEEHQFEGAKFN